MPHDLATTVLTYWSQLVYGTLEAVERMGVPGGNHLERKVVVVAANLTSSHLDPP
jgi:hypothetical protein